MTKTDVLIIGAGPSGLMVANLLARHGIRFRIVDKKSGPIEESRALVVHAKTLELLDRLGLAEEVVAAGQKLESMELLDNGKPAGDVSFLDNRDDDRTPYPFVLIYEQNRTEHLLLRSVNQTGIQVEWGMELVSLVQTSESVHAVLRRGEGEEEIIEATWAIGADGAHSSVRHALAVKFTGETYAQALFLADVDLEWKQTRKKVLMDLTRTGFNGYFPMPGGEQRYRLLGALPAELSHKDELSLDDLRDLLKTTSTLDPTIVRARWISVYRIHHRMSEHFRVGRLFLVGDAAHIHSPAGGQGMNTGIGDAYNLAWKLALVIKGQAHPSLLDSYEAERMPFARSILKGSDRGFSLQVTNSWIARQIKRHILPPLFHFVSSQSSLSKGVFWYLSQLWTTYQKSPVVATAESARKRPKAGDRAPYGLFEVGADSGQSIFAKMAGTDHQVLLFAGRRSNTARADVSALEKHLHALLCSYTLPLPLHVIDQGNRTLHERYRADEPSLFLVRPDGHLAYRGRADDLASLREYLETTFVKKS